VATLIILVFMLAHTFMGKAGLGMLQRDSSLQANKKASNSLTRL
jgi:hypothetical protein